MSTAQDTEQIPREAWHDALELLTREHEGNEVTVEVLRDDIGDQEEATRLPLNNIEYDRKDDVVVVAVGGHTARYPVVFRHLIHHPDTIAVHPAAPAITRTICVMDSDGLQTLVTMHRLPELPG
ncbi:MAG TPA: DUF5335 family protein [Acidimicrobiia bacterium]|jgi:hypothetical protein|nr:DUF5335 family protein [Acidimicrobiia bacterium]